MTTLHIAWRKDVNWPEQVKKVLAYYRDRPDLKYGPSMENKAGPLLDMLCEIGCASRTHLRKAIQLESDDAVATILSNVTMALQKGSVVSPEQGGWYTVVNEPLIYIPAPGFSAAWTNARGIV